MNPTDYPAAHSMDTEWFAVDRNGHVAFFCSGEAGAVPHQYIETYDVQTSMSDFVAALNAQPRNIFSYQIPPWMTHRILLDGEPATWETLPDTFQCVIVRHAVRLEPDESSVRITVPEGTFSEMYYYSKKDALKNFDSGEFTHVWVGTDLMTFFGFFTYDHNRRWENWVSGPYQRVGFPLKPINVADLPPDMQKQPAVVLSNQDFSRDRLIQPVVSLPCSSWQEVYVETDEKTIRPISPNNADKIGKEWRADLEQKGFIVAPPIDGHQK